MYGKCEHKERTHGQYDAGCVLCDAQDALLAYANGAVIYPNWMNDEGQWKDALELIRFIKRDGTAATANKGN